jgi:hypothetical protein
MLAVLALIGVFLGMAGVRLDLFGSGATRELETFRVFVNSQRARALRIGTTIRLEFVPQPSVVRVQDLDDDRNQTFRFKHWSIDHDQSQTVYLTPVGVFGPDNIHLVHGDQERIFNLDRLVGLLPKESVEP